MYFPGNFAGSPFLKKALTKRRCCIIIKSTVVATDSVRTEVDFLQIDKFSRTPIYEQVIDGIEREILTGELKPNSPVASVRALSVQFSVNPNTLQKAYTELERRGLCYSVPGSGRFVSPDAMQRLHEARSKLLDEITALSRELKLTGFNRADVINAVNKAYDENIIENNQTEEK